MPLKRLRELKSRAGLVAAAAVLLGLAALGCSSDNTAGPVKPVPLTLVAQGVGGSSARYPAPAGSMMGVAAADTDTIPVTFTKALLVVRDVRFVLPGESDDMPYDTLATPYDSLGEDHDEEDDSTGQVRFRGPFVIDLLSGHAERLDTLMVMPGDYLRVQGHLRALRSGDLDASAYPGLVGYTVWLEGTIDGDGGGPFSYLARIDNEFMIRGGFHVAADTPATAFVTFDVTKWLQGRDGHFLDPRILDNDKWIKQAIRHAIKVGMDDDHDGAMDDDMHEEEGD